MHGLNQFAFVVLRHPKLMPHVAIFLCDFDGLAADRNGFVK